MQFDDPAVRAVLKVATEAAHQALYGQPFPNPVPVYGGPLDGLELWLRCNQVHPYPGAELIHEGEEGMRASYVYHLGRWFYVKSWRESEATT